MRVAIIALILSIAALELAGFATFASLSDDGSTGDTAVTAEPGWSAEGCSQAEGQEGIGFILAPCLASEYDCALYNSLLQAISDNCP
jgi:hypothetical protein